MWECSYICKSRNGHQFSAQNSVAAGFMVFAMFFANFFCEAKEPAVISPPQRFIVRTLDAALMIGDEESGTVPLGTVVTATRAQGNWRYAPIQNGWIHVRDLVLMSQAIEHFTNSIEKEPTPTAYQLRGIAWMGQDEWAKAAQDFEKSYDLGESSIALHLNLGICYQRLGEPVAAIEEYDAILKTYPDDWTARLARGNILLQQGQYQASIRDFEKAAEQNSKSADIENSRGVALRMMGRYEDAIQAYSKAIEIDPQRADALSNRGYARKSLGEYAAAMKDYEAAILIAPNSDPILNDIAWILATVPDDTLRDGPRAVKISEKVCESTKNRNGEYLDTLAASYASTGRYSAAVEAAKLAITILKDHPGVSKIQERLALYEKEQPFLETTPEDQLEDDPPVDFEP